MKIKELQKTVNIAWSPLPQNPVYLAAGTAAQQFDSNGNSTLEIYSTNFSDPSYDLELKSSLPSQYRFQKIIWSPTGFDAAHRNGLIVGGCEGGHVMIYSAAKMLAGEEGLIARQDKHTGAVTGLDFNPFQTNLLASVASESEIFIWDLNNTTTHMNPGAKTQPLEDVKNVAWNRQVQHILASVFSSRCVIWDLRKSEQIIKLSDTQSRVRWHAIQWHPEVATQVWLASEDDQAPVVQLWDLRYATAPAKTMQIHQRGVLGMSWCPRDTDLMVSCGKDNHIYCWNPNTELPEGEILAEIATTSTWYSDVQWCPRNPALIGSSSLDGNVSIYSLFAGTQEQVQTSNKIADSFPGMDQFAQAPIPQQQTQIVHHDLKRAPKWMKRQHGVSFGFGGKLVDFNNKSKTVNISQVITEPELVERANALERSLGDGNYAEYCRQRADEMRDQNGRYLWYFIKANFDLNPKEEMLNLLGYNKEDIETKFAKYIKEEEPTQNDLDQLTNRISNLTHSDSSEVECDQSTDDSTDTSQPVDNSAIFDGIAEAQKLSNHEAERKLVQFKIPSGEHSDSLITEALLTGNLEAAVELCMESNRTAEALIIASTAGIEFLTNIQSRYLNMQNNELSQVISALVSRDWMDFVSRCTVDSWKEALCAALKHSDRKVVDICERLGDRLLAEPNNSIEYTRNAILCYICAGSIDKLVTAWYQLKQLEQQDRNYKLKTVELQELAEIVMLMSKSLEQQGIALQLDGKFAGFITEYGGLLASQGALTAALTYIFALGPNDNTEVDELRERINNTVNYKRECSQQPQQPIQSQNIYGRRQSQSQQQLLQQQQQQQQRGSFSHQLVGYPAANTNPPAPAIQNQFQSHPWNSPPSTAVGAQPPPTMFNPAQANSGPIPSLNPGLAQQSAPHSAKPPLVNEHLTSQPPRPQSASSQGGGIHARSKYVLDPSVAATGSGGYGGGYNPSAAMTSMSQNSFNNSPFNTNPLSGGMGGGPSIPQQSTIMQSAPVPNVFNPTPFSGGSNYIPGVPPIETVAQAPQQFQNIQRNPTPPPGWNDPPALKSTRANYTYQNNEMSAKHAGTRKWQKIINHETDSAINTTNLIFNNAFSANYSSPLFQETFLYQPKKVETPSNVAAPITHPLFGVDPNQNQNGYMDPNQYQNAAMSGMHPPPPPLSSNSGILNPAPQNPGFQTGGYLNPVASHNNNPPSQFPQQMNFQTSAIATQQQQQWNTPNMSYAEQPAPVQRQAEPPKEKPPLPEEYIYLQTVFEELKSQCLNSASDPRTKRKFVDVAKRLENLYDCLRDNRLTPATIGALNQIVQYIQIGDYGNALQTHTSIAFGSDFSQCAGFMPGLKVLMQSAADLQVYLR